MVDNFVPAPDSLLAPQVPALPDVPATPRRRRRPLSRLEAHVPCEWTLGQVLDSLRQHLTVENCVMEAGHGRFAIQLRVDCGNHNPTTLVHGAGRSFRVQQDTVAKNAVAFLWVDLERLEGLSFSRKFAET
eukprot:5736048-Amphidinium_carterae.1